MWNLPRFAADFFSGFEGGVQANVPDHFEQEYSCYPVSFVGREELERGNKILLPQSALNTLARMNVTWPMLFELCNPTLKRQTHCGVLEFSAEEGTCYMPYWMMRNLVLSEGDIVRVKNTSLPKGTYVKLQPVTSDFLEISDHRAVLEHALCFFATLTVGDNIIIQHNERNYEIEIVECRPVSAVSIIETDVNVDFAPPKDYIEPSPKPPVSVSTPSNTTVSRTDTPLGLESKPSESGLSILSSDNQMIASQSSFTLFGGTGVRLDGRSGLSRHTESAQSDSSMTLSSVNTHNKLLSSSSSNQINNNKQYHQIEETDIITPGPQEKNKMKRLPGGVRVSRLNDKRPNQHIYNLFHQTQCAEYAELIKFGRIPGFIGKTRPPISSENSQQDILQGSRHTDTNFALFGGKGYTFNDF